MSDTCFRCSQVQNVWSSLRGSELSAFVASKDDASTLRDTLRSHLAARLPSYAVPQRLAVMDRV